MFGLRRKASEERFPPYCSLLVDEEKLMPAWLSENGEWWLWWSCGWPVGMGMLNRISATVVVTEWSLSLLLLLWPLLWMVCGPGIVCLHFRLRPLMLATNAQVPFQGEVKE